MMSIEEFKKAKIEAMKKRDKNAVAALEVVITKLMNAIIEKRAQNMEITKEDTLVILQKTEKELLEEREGLVKAGRIESLNNLDEQINTIRKYLPEMLSQEKIREIINTLPDRSVPFVMKHFKTNYLGKCDMKLVNETLKTI